MTYITNRLKGERGGKENIFTVYTNRFIPE